MSSDTVEFVNRLLDEIAGLQYGRSYNMLTVAEREDVMRRACISRPTPSRMATGRTGTAQDARTDGAATPTRTNVDKARQRLVVRFDAFARRIHDGEREDFFHPCNADSWVREFARWLEEEQTASANIRTSND